jgi:hypothetical protein
MPHAAPRIVCASSTASNAPFAAHNSQGAAGLQYSSKLDDFDTFVSHSKLSVLPLAPTAPAAAPAAAHGPTYSAAGPGPSSQQQQSLLQPATQQQGAVASGSRAAGNGKLLLLDDLPFVGDSDRRQRLMDSLRTLCLTSRCPVVLVTTESSGSSGGGRGGGGEGGGGLGAMGGFSKGLHKDVVALLDSLGAATITFNPITTNALSKALMALAAAEGVDLPQPAAAAIAQAADGDLRNAMQNLQVYSGCAAKAAPAAPAKGGRKRAAAGAARGKAAAADEGQQQRLAAQVGRDQRLSLYHALGKLLHNKRERGDADGAAAAAAAGGGEAPGPGAKKPAKRQKKDASGSGRQAGVFEAQAEVELPEGVTQPELRPECVWLLGCFKGGSLGGCFVGVGG